ncbi:MAG TPA: DNA repair protein RecO [Longimicrobiales bacterium]|nr:DNA repair protein RecO [Longimicrobiales bacterium]
MSTNAILLRAHDYGETSRVLRFCTERHGLLSVMAKGVRGRTGKGVAALATFASGELTAYVRPHRDLHTMKDFVCRRTRDRIAHDVLRFAGASTVAEIVLAHAEHEWPAGLHAALEAALDRLEDAEPAAVPAAVLAGLWAVVGALGFTPQVEACVRCGRALGPDEMGRFDLAAGGIRCTGCGEEGAGPRMGPIARGQLVELLEGRAPADLTHARRHAALVADFVAHHVVPRPLKSLPFLSGLLPDPTPALP